MAADRVRPGPLFARLHFFKSGPSRFCFTTVDGRNPAPVDKQFIPLFTRFYTSQVVQDFFHQQYFPARTYVYQAMLAASNPVNQIRCWDDFCAKKI